MRLEKGQIQFLGLFWVNDNWFTRLFWRKDANGLYVKRYSLKASTRIAELNLLDRVDEMCVESCSPDEYEAWENVKAALIKNRHLYDDLVFSSGDIPKHWPQP